MDKYDVVVIGAGPSGLSVSKTVAKSGKKVLIVDKDPLGGTCLNYGCMPTKFRLRFGKDASSLEQQRKMVTSLNSAIEKSLRKQGIDVLRGKAQIKDERLVVVDGKEILAENVVVTIGSKSRTLLGVEFDGRRIFRAEDLLWYWPNREINLLQIIGAGPIGIEFAFMFRPLAKRIVVCDVADEILPREDKELAGRLRAFMKKMGVEFILGRSSSLIEEADIVLISIGREADKEGIEELFSGQIKVDLTESGYINVDEYLCSSVDWIYCAGECIGKMFFAYTASYEGKVCALNLLGKKRPIFYPAIPRCVFSDPPFCSVGFPEQGLIYGTLNYPHGEMYYLYPVTGKIKVGIDSQGIVRFAGIFGPGASELLPLFTLAIEKEMRFSDLKEMLYVHPTLSEAVARINF